MALPPDERPASESRAGPACWAEKNSRLLLILILVLAAGLRFWNVTHGLDRPLAISVDDDADKKFASARSLALEGDVHLPAYRRHLLYRQPMFLLRSYAGIWRTVSVLGLHPSDRTMRIGFNAYLIVISAKSAAARSSWALAKASSGKEARSFPAKAAASRSSSVPDER